MSKRYICLNLLGMFLIIIVVLFSSLFRILKMSISFLSLSSVDELAKEDFVTSEDSVVLTVSLTS